MNLPLSTIIVALPLLLISINPDPASANFFPNISAIPSSLIPNTTAWDAFTALVGSRKGQKAAGVDRIKKYFQYFGYLNSSYSDFSDEFDEFLESAVKTYQINFNLSATGVLDAPTLKRVVQPRCGNADVVNGTSTMNAGNPNTSRSANSSVAHYSFFPNRPRWPPSKSELTYAFLSENQLSDVVKSVFSRAFERWSEVTPLTFSEISSFRSADIKIGFFNSGHGDGEPFDGVLGTLAHAFSPPAGLLHMDGDENWVIDGNFLNGSPLSAVDLESVAVHEIGHILGLGHSSIPDAIMFPSISSGMRKVELASDDVSGVQELYGSNPNYNGSSPDLTPTGQRDTSGSHNLDYSLWEIRIRLAGLLAVLLIFV